jgi:hypothetical protein
VSLDLQTDMPLASLMLGSYVLCGVLDV